MCAAAGGPERGRCAAREVEGPWTLDFVLILVTNERNGVSLQALCTRFTLVLPLYLLFMNPIQAHTLMVLCSLRTLSRLHGAFGT